MKKRLLHRFYPCATAPSLLQQLVQFIINGLDLRADNDLTGVFPRTEDACCACRFYGLLIDLIVVLDHKAQAGSAVADRYYVVFAADAFQNVLCNQCVFVCFGRVYFFLSRFVFPGVGNRQKATAHTTTTQRMTSNVVEFIKTLLFLSDKTQRVLICKHCRMLFVYPNTISLFCLVPFQLYTDILSFLVDRYKLPLRRKSRIMRKGGICRTVSVFGHIVPQGHL